MTDPTASKARQAVLEHVSRWNLQDKDRWLALFADGVRYEDPPGTVAGVGKGVMSEHAWDRSFTPQKRWVLEPLFVVACGNEAQVHMRNHGSVAGRPVWLDSIELWEVDEAGLVTSIRAFWEPPDELREHLGLSQWEQ